MEKYIIITGGELSNKGAESMTFVTVSEINKKFPEHKVLLLSASDYNKTTEEKGKYIFEILPLNTILSLNLLGGGYKFLSKIIGISTNKNRYIEEVKILDHILMNTDLIVDISGYHLSSQGGILSSLIYLSRLLLARKRSISIYLMPQSFGPFNYGNSFLDKMMNYLIKKHLGYAEKIFAREVEGYNILKNYGLNNVYFSNDLVLSNTYINEETIFNNKVELTDFSKVNGVAIVPNMRNFEFGDKNEILEIYAKIIRKLFEFNQEIYLVRHSKQDLIACELIKDMFKEDKRVKLITDDLSSLEFDDLVKRFDFIIGSRFHSIVHAYKNAIPAIALGWATKYHELLATFEQSDYIFDVRNGINTEEMMLALEKLSNRYAEESIVIKQRLAIIQSENVFDALGKND